VFEIYCKTKGCFFLVTVICHALNSIKRVHGLKSLQFTNCVIQTVLSELIFRYQVHDIFTLQTYIHTANIQITNTGDKMKLSAHIDIWRHITQSTHKLHIMQNLLSYTLENRSSVDRLPNVCWKLHLCKIKSVQKLLKSIGSSNYIGMLYSVLYTVSRRNLVKWMLNSAFNQKFY